MEKKKGDDNANVEHLFRDARKSGYPGNFNDFVGKYYPEKAGHFVNDTGKQEIQQPVMQAPEQNATEQVVDKAVIRPMYNNSQGPVFQEPVYRNVGGKSSDVKSKDEDTTILGMNKYLFYGLALLVFIGLGTGAYFLFFKPKANKLEAGGLPGAGTTPAANAPVSGILGASGVK